MANLGRIGWVLIGGFLLGTSSGASALDLDRCAHRLEVPPGETAVLTQDITCGYFCTSAPSQPCDPNEETPCALGGACAAQSLFLGDGAELHLNGHRITAGHQVAPVHCGLDGERGRCAIVGAGVITCSHGAGIVGQQMNVVVRDGVVVEGCDYGIGGAYQVLVRDSEVRDCEVGISGRNVRVENVTLRNESWDIQASVDVRVDDVSFGALGGGIEAGRRLHGSDLMALGGTIYAPKVRLTRLNSTQSPGVQSFGLVTRHRPVLEDSVITGHTEADILSGKKPVLVDSTCGKSQHLDAPATSWGVCSGD